MSHGLFYRCPCYVTGNIAVRERSDFIKNILICVPKINEGLTGLEQHEGE